MQKKALSIGLAAAFGVSVALAPLLASGASRTALSRGEMGGGTGVSSGYLIAPYPYYPPEGEVRPYYQNRPPVISGVSGPSQLYVGEIGTWEIRAYDPEGGMLRYSVDWGEEIRSLEEGETRSPFFTQRTTFTHSYSSSGLFTVVFTVSDQSGASSRATIDVKVVGKKRQKPFVDLKINGSDGPISVRAGDALMLRWNSKNVRACYAFGSWSGQKALKGKQKLFAPKVPGTYAYAIRCQAFPWPLPLYSERPERDAVSHPKYFASDRVVVKVLAKPVRAGFIMVGDLDKNGRVSIHEVIKMVDFMLDKAQPTKEELKISDADANGLVEESDITFAIDNLLERKPVRAVKIDGAPDLGLVLAGDLDQNGSVTIGELSRVGRFVSGKEIPNSAEKMISDADADGDIDYEDLKSIKANFLGDKPFRCVSKPSIIPL